MQHINGLRDAHDLKREKRKRVTLYAADVRNMIELAHLRLRGQVRHCELGVTTAQW